MRATSSADIVGVYSASTVTIMVWHAGAVDVYYPAAGGARGALVVAADERFDSIVDERLARLEHVRPYRPGAFYDRELPVLRAVLAGADPLDLLVVDGYVDLDPTGRPGLGAHVHAEFA